ncbi:MAG TPA: hypothetical protein VFG83_16795 [Kofleriaceae bacterium]|nr:hypothetical protein [Kofleriaceae bacterium]
MTRERPILFSGEMVRAILGGRKTQTRRVITVPWRKGKRCHIEEDGELLAMDEYGDCHPMVEQCPYGKPGDLLWVREAWFAELSLDAIRPSLLPHDERDGALCPCWFAADHSETPRVHDGLRAGRLRPSIHMPRWASRITLEVTEVRVQRVQEISEEDAAAEGAAHRIAPGGDLAGAFEGIDAPIGYRAHFRDLWDRINGRRTGCAWADNPWVWAVSFRVVSISGREVKP